MLKWLKQRGCVFTADTCAAAAASPQAARMLQYLHSEGVPFDARTSTEAISHQELPVLQWLCEHGCNLSEVDPLAPRQMHDVKILSWLHSNGCPCDYNLLCEIAALEGSISTLQWVKDNGLVDWSSEVLSECLNIAAADEELNTAKVHKVRVNIFIYKSKCTRTTLVPLHLHNWLLFTDYELTY
jgi:hypothetical protein